MAVILALGCSVGAAECTVPGGTACAAGVATATAAAVARAVIRALILTMLSVVFLAQLRIRAKLTRMGIYYRKRKKTGKNSWINLSGSGASMSTKVGPVTFNSRGGMWVNLPGGLNFRGRWR